MNRFTRLLRLLSRLVPVSRFQFNQFKITIMATQPELTNDLKAVLEQQKKTATEIAGVQAETNTLKDKVAELEAVIANGPAVSQELADAVAAVKAQSQVVDDAIPDVVVEPAAPEA